jgi:hypothetical protein
MERLGSRGPKATRSRPHQPRFDFRSRDVVLIVERVHLATLQGKAVFILNGPIRRTVQDGVTRESETAG